MPVIRSAKKKLRQDKKRTERNKYLKDLAKENLKKARRKPSEKTIKEAIKAIDKLGAKNILHKNKVARVKSSLSKLLGKKGETTQSPPAKRKHHPKK